MHLKTIAGFVSTGFQFIESIPGYVWHFVVEDTLHYVCVAVCNQWYSMNSRYFPSDILFEQCSLKKILSGLISIGFQLIANIPVNLWFLVVQDTLYGMRASWLVSNNILWIECIFLSVILSEQWVPKIVSGLVSTGFQLIGSIPVYLWYFAVGDNVFYACLSAC